jgi:hypothetical protein
MGQEMVTTTESVKHNVELPADRFALPERIQKLVDEEEAKAPEKEG